MNTFKTADFTPSVLPDTAAWAVFNSLWTGFDTYKFMLRQSAVSAAAAVGQKFFQQQIVVGLPAVGPGKKPAAQAQCKTFFTAHRKRAGIIALGRRIKRVGAAQNPVEQPETVP